MKQRIYKTEHKNDKFGWKNLLRGNNNTQRERYNYMISTV